MNQVLANIKRNAVALLEDGPRFKVRFDVRSSSSNQIYRISWDNAPGAQWWTCSCRGNIRHGQCKHLTACGLKGRRYGHQRLSNYFGGELVHAHA